MIARRLWAGLAVCVAFPTGAKAQAATNAAPDGHMAPLAEYLMPRDSEIALARSAAPPSLSRDAKILVLSERGYETAAPGSNGFDCLVARSWGATVDIPAARFWNPKFRIPICFNAQGVEGSLREYLMFTKWALAGASEQEIGVKQRAAWASGELPETPAAGAMSYMMSEHGWGVGGNPGPWRPHLMFYYPTRTAPNWGANLDGTPVGSSHASGNAGTTVLVVVVPFWSDGSPGPTTSK